MTMHLSEKEWCIIRTKASCDFMSSKDVKRQVLLGRIIRDIVELYFYDLNLRNESKANEKIE